MSKQQEKKDSSEDHHDDPDHEHHHFARRQSMSIREGALFEEIPFEVKSDDEKINNLGPGESMLSVYGKPVTQVQAAALVPPGTEGLRWHAQLVRPDYSHPKHTTAPGVIKPRRPVPTVLESDFFNSLTKTADGRWIFSGVLNGWPALQAFELESITTKVRRLTGSDIKRTWNKGSNTVPAFPKKAKYARVTLRAPAWSTVGYNADSPGCAWWFHAQRPDGMVLNHGENMLSFVREQKGPVPRAVKAHFFHHRYARGAKPETSKNQLTYHAAVLLEWDHGKFCSVIELATLNGIGGRYGKSNWFPDKIDPRPIVYRHLPACMVGPWMGQFAEVRCADIKAKDVKEFKQYLDDMTGADLRFLVPEIIDSQPIRISHNSQDDIMRYLINYVSRDRDYTEEFRNCQSFAADFFGFICGKKDIVPTVRVNRITYKRRPHMFLYNSAMF